MADNIITWNVPNWITIVLMAMLGFFLLSTVASVWNARKGSGS